MEEEEGVSGETTITHRLKNNGFGKLTHTGTDVWVESCIDDDDHHRALDISHPNYLPCYFYDPIKKLLFHPKFDSDFNTYINKMKTGEGRGKGKGQGKPEPVVAIFRIPVLKDGEDSGERESHTFLNPVYRSILKMMIGFVVDEHMRGHSLTTFSERNIVFVGDTMKFVHLGFPDGSEPTRRANFLCLHGIIVRLLDNSDKDKPQEVVDLLSLLKDPPDCTSPSCGLLMLHSMAIMSPKEAMQFFISCNERIQFLDRTDRRLFWDAIRAMKICDGWSDRFTKLEDEARYYTDLSFRNTKQRKKDYSFDSASSSDSKVKGSLFRCCRNITVHLKDEVPDDVQLTELHVERMVIVVFYNDLLSLQKEMHRCGCLEPFVLNN